MNNQNKTATTVPKKHEHNSTKTSERDVVVLLYRCRMITVPEACARIGIRRTAFYAMLQNHYGFKEGKFKALTDEGFQGGMEGIIRSIVDEQGAATCALTDYLCQLFQKKKEAGPAESQAQEIQTCLTNNDILVLNREARGKLLEKIYEMGYKAGAEASAESFDAARWLKETVKSPQEENEALKALISVATKKAR